MVNHLPVARRSSCQTLLPGARFSKRVGPIGEQRTAEVSPENFAWFSILIKVTSMYYMAFNILLNSMLTCLKCGFLCRYIWFYEVLCGFIGVDHVGIILG